MQFWKGLDRTEKVSFGQRLAGKRWRLGCSGDPRVVQGASFRAGGVRTEPLACASQVPALCGHRCVGLPSPTGTSFKLAVQPLIPQDAEGQVVSPEASAPLLSSTEHRGAGPCRARLRSPRAQGPLGGVRRAAPAQCALRPPGTGSADAAAAGHVPAGARGERAAGCREGALPPPSGQDKRGAKTEAARHSGGLNEERTKQEGFGLVAARAATASARLPCAPKGA